MQLTSEEEKMLRGEMGPAIQKAIEYQIKVGEFWNAEKLIKVNNVHMMGDIEVMGEGGYHFLQEMVELGAKAVVNTTTNARCFDFSRISQLNQNPASVEKEKELISFLQQMNILTTDTCINYQSIYQPHFKEPVAWGDTGTVIYANSVLGARTNFESGPSALAAGITGRVPEYGFHLDKHRKGNILVKIKATLKDFADWGAIGKIVGQKHQNYFSVPVFDGIVKHPSSDELKHLGAALASYGSMGMFHIAGITPEARTLEEAFGNNEPDEIIIITDEDIENIYKGYDLKDGITNLVVFSAPHLSLFELKKISEKLDGKKINPNMWLIVTINSAIKNVGQQLGYIQNIEKAGGIILEGVCFYILHSISQMRIDNGWTNLVTNSAKLANIIGAHKFHPILRRTEDCIDTALTGRIN
jgi:predicted aconitase